MHKSILVLLLSLLFAACAKDSGMAPLDETQYPNPDAKKALTGSFVTFYDKDNWAPYQWSSLLEGMKKIGMRTVIAQFSAHDQQVWFDTNETFVTQKSKYALGRLLAAAAEKGMEVYVGLYFDETYWKNQTSETWLDEHANRCNRMATEINALYGTQPAFKGWYIPHEPEPYAYNTEEKMNLFRTHFVDRISNHLHQLNNKPVAIAAFWNSTLSTPEQLQTFMSQLAKCNLQVIMLQDGVGVGHVSLDRLETYYKHAETGLFGDGSAFKGEFWTDLETFNKDNSPASISRVSQQLSIELAIPRITRAVSFDYYSNMCPTGPFGRKAQKLRNDYHKLMSF